MHGTPVQLLNQQLKSIGIENKLIRLPHSPSMEVYEKQMSDMMDDLKKEGFSHAAFGDIFLEDLKKYREMKMQNLDFKCVFPIWKKNTTKLIHKFIELGFKAVVVAANDQLGSDFLGREIDKAFLDDLPVDIDPCGENGEFHTFCYDGPIFQQPVNFRLGEKVKRSYPNPSGEGSVHFWFIDLLED